MPANGSLREARPPSLRVQDRQPHLRVVAQEPAQLLAAYGARTALLVFEEQGAPLGLLDERTVPDEVKDVVLPLPQAPLQAGQSGSFEALRLHHPAALETRQGLGQVGPLAAGVEG